jgi:hypothetical protein
MQVHDILKYTINLIDKLEIPYMLTGSMALNNYTIPRSTRDIDIVVQLVQNYIPKLIDAIKDEFYYHEPTIIDEIKRKGMFNLIHRESSFKIDFIILSDNFYETEKFNRRRMIFYEDIKLFIITVEDLIISKLNWIQGVESELQKRDIIQLLQVQDIDMDYIRKWCKSLNLKTYNLIEI